MKETKENTIIDIAVEDLTNCALNQITERFRKSTADLKATMNSRYVFIAQVIILGSSYLYDAIRFAETFIESNFENFDDDELACLRETVHASINNEFRNLFLLTIDASLYQLKGEFRLSKEATEIRMICNLLTFLYDFNSHDINIIDPAQYSSNNTHKNISAESNFLSIYDLAVNYKIADSICIVTIFNLESNSPILIFQVKLSIPEVEQPKLHKFLSSYPFFEDPLGIIGEEI